MRNPVDLHPARFYAILDRGYVDNDHWESVCRQMVSGRADLIQIRAKEVSSEERRKLVDRVYPIIEPSGIPIIINDDLELARSIPNAGLHLGQDDESVERARRLLGPSRIIGLSTHSTSQAKKAIESSKWINYFAVGPVFATPTKPTYEPVGCELVSIVASLRPSLPWFCIGGIKLHNLEQVASVGAERIVVVSELLQSENIPMAIANYKEALNQTRQVLRPPTSNGVGRALK